MLTASDITEAWEKIDEHGISSGSIEDLAFDSLAEGIGGAAKEALVKAALEAAKHLVADRIVPPAGLHTAASLVGTGMLIGILISDQARLNPGRNLPA